VSRFYLRVWFFWALRLTFCSLGLALLLATFITLFIYINEGMVPLEDEVIDALWSLERFWFMIMWSFTILVALFRSLKYIFGVCYQGYKFELLSCPHEGRVEVIQKIAYGDLIRVWRKWFMLLIWLVGAMMIFALSATYLFSEEGALFAWFDIYTLFISLLIAGYFSFIFISSRCKKVRLKRC